VTAYRIVLASSSPARLKTLRATGVFPEVLVPGVDETTDAPDTESRVRDIALRKGEAAKALLGTPNQPTVLIAADTMLDMGGVSHGKPHDADVARQRLRAMSGSSGVLYTGHYAAVAPTGGPWRQAVDVAATVVHFARMTDDEIEGYLATGEPLEVAGSFTIDGFGGPFITGIEGDPHNVVGLSLPLLRVMLAGLDVPWTALWASTRRARLLASRML